jgi:predicted alpha/beta-hydrolase family hydrolase
MGGRIGCHLSLVEKVHAVVCLGYPLFGGGDPAKMRDKVLLEMNTPILFIQGTRDSLCPLPLFESVRAKMRTPTRLEVVKDGDHSLQVTRRQLKASGETQHGVEKQLAAVIAEFVQSPSTG